VQTVRGRRGRFIDATYRRIFNKHRAAVQEVANQILEAITEKMLADGCHAVLEMIAEPSVRGRFRAVAERHGVPFRQIECVCTDRAELLSRLAGRPGDWEAILRRIERTYMPPDPGECLMLDTARPAEEALSATEAYLGGPAA
jgi:predicted kinase